MFIGKVKDWGDLDALIEKYKVRCCLIPPQPEPHLVAQWANTAGYRIVQQLTYLNDGISPPNWDPEGQRVTVDRTVALNSAFEEIKAGLCWIPPGARAVDNGGFYAQMKAPTRVRDMADGTVRYRWVETGPLEHYRHAQAFDHIAAEIARRNPSFASCVDIIDEDFRSSGLRARYDDILPRSADYDWWRRMVRY